MLAVAMLVGMAAGTEAYAASKKRAKARTTATTKKSGLKGQIKASNGVVYSLKQRPLDIQQTLRNVAKGR